MKFLRVILLGAAGVSLVACGGDGGGGGGGWDGGPFIPPMVVDCTHVGSGTAYEVGEGQDYENLGDVPWYDLGPGDTVRIHYREEPYREKVLISNSGAEGDPIRLCGVVGPNNEMPVIDGDGATTSENQHWHQYLPLQDVGVIVTAEDDDDDYGTRPEWITIEGLVVRGGRNANTYTNSEGTTKNYEGLTAGIYLVPAAHVVIRGCVLTDNDAGFFSVSKDETDAHVVEDVLFEGNYVGGNGVEGVDRRHNAYFQALGVTIQFNRFDRLIPGAMGGNLKDRSAGTIVRYNWIEGGARQIDLVDAQEHAQHALADPRYHETYVYGNVILNDDDLGDGNHIVHYGGDTLGFEQNFRKGTLYFYNNTLYTNASAAERYRTAVIEVATNDETVDMRNNIIIREGDTNMALVGRDGVLELGVNWVTDGYWPAYEDFTGRVEGEDNLITGTNPMLDGDMRPLAESPAIDMSEPLADTAPPADWEYVIHQQGRERPERGSGVDLGAFEAE